LREIVILAVADAHWREREEPGPSVLHVWDHPLGPGSISGCAFDRPG